MLCGVGGRTVAEAQQAMSYAEFLDWCRYRNQYGSLHVGMRIDRAIARFMLNYFKSRGHESVKFEDFSPYDTPPEASPEDVFNMLQSAFKADR